MSDRTEVPAKVEAAVNQMSNISSADMTAFKMAEDGSLEVTLSIDVAVDGDSDESDESADPSNSNAVEGGQEDDEGGFEFDHSDSSNSNAVDSESEQEYPDLIQIGEDEYRCPLCESYEGSKGQVNGHKGHCDSPSNSTAVEEESENEENDTSPSNSTAVEGKCGAECQDGSPCQIEVPCHHHSNAVEDDDTSSSNSNAVDKEEVPHPDEAENPTKENYVVHFGECEADDCSYGTNGADQDFCASHQNSTASKGSSKKSKVNYEDLTEGQKAAARDLISDEGMDLEEAIQMV